MRLLDFTRENARWLGAGVLLTCSSSFGQTYFIALSAAHVQGAFNLSHGGWGGIYTLGTLMSAITLMQNLATVFVRDVPRSIILI